MLDRNSKHHEMKWLVMDVTKMDAFVDSSMDAAIDKGTLDAVMCDSSIDTLFAFSNEVHRILRPGLSARTPHTPHMPFTHRTLCYIILLRCALICAGGVWFIVSNDTNMLQYLDGDVLPRAAGTSRWKSKFHTLEKSGPPVYVYELSKV